MTGTFIAPARVKLTGDVTATGGREFVTVWTIQKGKAPAVKATGEGLKAVLTVGDQTIRFDGEKLRLAR